MEPTLSQQPSTLTPGGKLSAVFTLRSRVTDPEDDAAIWLAYDEVLGKEISLHFLPAAVRGDARAMGELREEVRRNRQLIHPNILRVYDFIEEADWAAISMDWFEGESLAALRRKKEGGFFEPAEVKPWLAEICPALDDVHKINLAHGDLAPRNLLLEKSGKLLVANFGISRVIEEALERARQSGGSGGDGGEAAADRRLAYLSPQQLDGERLSPADDVYALGATVYELLTGEAPFSGGEMVMKIRREMPEAMRERRAKLEKRRGTIPEVWETAVAACLSKKAEARPRLLAALAAELEAAAGSGDPTLEADLPAMPPAASAAETIETAPLAEVPLREQEAATEAGPAGLIAGNERRQDATPRSSSAATRFAGIGAAAAALALLAGMAIHHFGKERSGPKGSDSGALRAVGEAAAGEAAVPAEPREEFSHASEQLAERAPSAPPLPAQQGQSHAASGDGLQGAMVLIGAKSNAAGEPPLPSSPSASSGAVPKAAAAAPEGTSLETMQQNAAAAEKNAQLLQGQQQQAEAAAAEAKKALEGKMKGGAPVSEAVKELRTQRKQKEEAANAADVAAQQARQAADDKAKVAEAAKKALADWDAANGAKLSAQSNAEAEIQALQKGAAEKQAAATAAAKATAEGIAASRAQAAALVKAQEMEKARLAEESRTRAAKQNEFEEKLKQMKALQDALQQQMQQLEQLKKELGPPEASPRAAAPAASSLPAPAPHPAGAPAPGPVAGVSLPDAEMSLVPASFSPPTAAPKVAAPKSASRATPEPARAPAAKSGSGETENSLGMKFLPVGNVLFCIWPTRVQDFEVFAKESGFASNAWLKPGFEQGPSHPVVNVSWNDAVAFCKWLTDRERKQGFLSAAQFYRLPTDLEWSKAVGLPEETGKTPADRDLGILDVFPWGTQWPPPANAGNYTGEETGSEVAIKGYNDGYAWTSPVGSYTANKFGLYDMGGNVWQWCMDNWTTDSHSKVLRGGSWYNGLKLSLLSSCRVSLSPDKSTDNYGFRVVRTAETSLAKGN